MYYLIQHNTRYRYSEPVTESVMELRMSPRTEGVQRCWRFKLLTSPTARLTEYRDYLGNTVHFFDIPGQHRQLTITAEAVVEIGALSPVPDAVTGDAWAELDERTARGEFWESLHPGERTQPSAALAAFARDLDVRRRGDPLSLLRELNGRLYAAFDYDQETTTVDSTIDEVVAERRGVCQDFAHVMAALVRAVGIPCRYVSGYLYHEKSYQDRSVPDATHAWVEAWLPSLGWIGFDPTNNVLAEGRHIRVAVGRDYADVPPTHGVFKGDAESELEVEVRVEKTEPPSQTEELLPVAGWASQDEARQQIQMQQQQQ
jgi:transglutaminase-like putative cysteine protease